MRYHTTELLLLVVSCCRLAELVPVLTRALVAARPSPEVAPVMITVESWLAGFGELWTSSEGLTTSATPVAAAQSGVGAARDLLPTLALLEL